LYGHPNEEGLNSKAPRVRFSVSLHEFRKKAIFSP